jgi:hypothetical protein
VIVPLWAVPSVVSNEVGSGNTSIAVVDFLVLGVLVDVSEQITVTENVHCGLVIQQDPGLREFPVLSNLTCNSICRIQKLEMITRLIEFPIDNARIEEHGPGLRDGTSIGLVLPIWWARILGLVVIDVCEG